MEILKHPTLPEPMQKMNFFRIWTAFVGLIYVESAR